MDGILGSKKGPKGTKENYVHSHFAAATKLRQSCPTLCDAIDGSPPGPRSLGFSRQEYWSGLPFPSPMHESEKGKGSRSVMSDSSRPHGLQPPRLLHPWDFLGKSTGVGRHCLLLHSPVFIRKTNCTFGLERTQIYIS